MGTASLVFGIVLIGFGIFFTILPLIGVGGGELTVEGSYFTLIVIIGLFAIGGLLLRGFDKDRKKDAK